MADRTNFKISENLTQISKYHSTVYALACGIGCLSIIYGCFTINHWIAYLIGFILLAGIQHHMMTLVHDGAHYSFHPDGDWNDFLSDILCAYPLATFTNVYRAFHLSHHRFEGDPKRDPEILVYSNQGRGQRGVNYWIRFFFLGITGYSGLIFARDVFRFVSRREVQGVFGRPSAIQLQGFILYQAVLALFSFLLFGTLWPLLFWYGSLMTLAMMFLKLHGLGEHHTEAYSGNSNANSTYTRTASGLLEFFIYPINSGYHLEHHKFSSVPWYFLPRLRKELETNQLFKKELDQMHLDGYFQGSNSVLQREFTFPQDKHQEQDVRDRISS